MIVKYLQEYSELRINFGNSRLSLLDKGFTLYFESSSNGTLGLKDLIEHQNRRKYETNHVTDLNFFE